MQTSAQEEEEARSGSETGSGAWTSQTCSMVLAARGDDMDSDAVPLFLYSALFMQGRCFAEVWT